MAIHSSKNSMIKEALQECIEVADFCIGFDKTEDDRWKNTAGCYGYPAGLLLLSIVDAIGTEIMRGGDDMSQHFKILNHNDYYNLELDDKALNALMKEYRNRLAHNAYIGENVILDIGNKNDLVIENYDSIYKLNLFPFLIISKKVVEKFNHL